MEGVAPPFAAVLFDLDGVLRNTEPYHRMAYAQLARSLSGGAPPDAGEIAGKSNLQLYEALVARFGGPATAEELSQRHFRLVCQLLEEYRVGPMPGLEEAGAFPLGWCPPPGAGTWSIACGSWGCMRTPR